MTPKVIPFSQVDYWKYAPAFKVVVSPTFAVVIALNSGCRS